MPTRKYTIIDDYISDFPQEIQALLTKMRETIRDAAPDAEDALFYNAPAIKQNGEIIVQFAAFKKHIGFYPMPSGINKFKNELSNYKIATSTIRFPFGKPIPYDLVYKITKFRLSEVQIDNK